MASKNTESLRPVRVSAAVASKYRRRLQRANQQYKEQVDKKANKILEDIASLDRSNPGEFQAQVARMQRSVKSLDKNLAAANKRSVRAVDSFVLDMQRENKKRTLRSFKKTGSEEVLKGKMAERQAALDKRVEKLAEGYRQSIRAANGEYSTRVQRILYEALAMPSRRPKKTRKDINRARGIVTRQIKNTVQDQSHELNATLNRSRQAALGSKAYRWNTQRDEKVREQHALQDRQEYRWAKRPPATGHPGEDHGCRCYASPVVPRGSARARAV